jgi:hypothetical protein
MMPANEVTGCLSYLGAPEDMDQWPSAKATELAAETIAKMIKLGFEGVKLESYQLADGRVVINFLTKRDTPEGRMTEGLRMLARSGVSLPVEKSISILERIYREQGLPFPSEMEVE